MEESQEHEQAGQEQSVPLLSGAKLIRFKCIMNAEYHADRERYYSAFHKVMMFAVVISGFAAFGLEMGHINLAPFFTFTAGAAGTIDLVFDLDGKARLHANFKRHYVDLRSRLEYGEEPKGIEVELLRTSADEPPVVHPVIELACNTTVYIMGLNKDQLYDLTHTRILLRHLWPYGSIRTKRDKRRDEELARSRVRPSPTTSS